MNTSPTQGRRIHRLPPVIVAWIEWRWNVAFTPFVLTAFAHSHKLIAGIWQVAIVANVHLIFQWMLQRL
jgi:hypothetical protein